MQLFHLTKSAVNQIAKTVQAKIKFGLKAGLKFDLPVLGLAGCHGRKWKRLSRYVDWASPIHITVQQMRLRWMETSEAHSIPLLSKKFYIFTDGSHTHPPAGGWEIKVPTMRWKWRRREMRMRWRWQWDKSYLTRTQRGERKRRGKENTPTHET